MTVIRATLRVLDATPTAGYSDDGTLTVAIYALPVMLALLAVFYLFADRYLKY